MGFKKLFNTYVGTTFILASPLPIFYRYYEGVFFFFFKTSDTELLSPPSGIERNYTNTISSNLNAFAEVSSPGLPSATLVLFWIASVCILRHRRAEKNA